MNVGDFDFHLPDDLIAQTAAPRGESRMLVLHRETGSVSHAWIRDLPRYLRPRDLLVANDTRVFPARLLGHRVPSGGAVECLLLAREQSVSPHDQIWSALVHPGQKLKPGAKVRFEPGLNGEILEQQFFGRRRVRLWPDEDGDVDALVDAIGHVPLPPYIHRPDALADRERYQTIFAEPRGSVAAPTAGLHFDRALLESLTRGRIGHATLTLHVGYGTFKPVRTATIEEHVVDPEAYSIPGERAHTINRTRVGGGRVIAVVTPTTRALEDAALHANGPLTARRADATVFIHPGFTFKVIDGLITNFHLPRSSLLMLVAAFAGRERVLAAYREAVEQRYRFYSYGDAMLII